MSLSARTGLLLVTTIFGASGHAASSRRWGPDGHRIVAAVALGRLSPAVAAETRRLLGGRDFTEIASWADEVRPQFPATAPWHYVDIEIGDSSYVPARDCKENACIVWALNTEIAALGNPALPDSARATALKWVVHLVGDIHQPLHAGERGDKGGNSVKGLSFQGHLTNLHALWDSGLLLSWGRSDDAIVARLNGEITHRTDIARVAGGSVAQWAMESHDLARDVVYRNLPNSLEITPAYADAARPIIEEQLVRAGVRLAAVIEHALGSSSR
jgi:hypothetical protein